MEISHKLKIIYSEIVKGYSTYKTPLFKTIHISHPSIVQMSELDIVYEEAFEFATNHGLLNQKDREIQLFEEGSWTTKDEEELNDCLLFLDGLYKTKSKLLLKSQIEQFNVTIKETEDKKLLLEQKKLSVIGLTCENFASKKVSEKYMFLFSHKDKGLKENFFSEDDFNYLEIEHLEELVKIYNRCSSELSDHNIKRIALSPIFLNAFFLAEDDPYTFYGKPIVNLTMHQVGLFSQGRTFKNMLVEQPNLSEELMADPSAFEENYNARKNTQKVLDEAAKHSKGNPQNVSLVGATRKDLEALGLGGQVVNLSAEAAKHGGSLTMDQLIKLHGE